jgi:hypothetical protein
MLHLWLGARWEGLTPITIGCTKCPSLGILMARGLDRRIRGIPTGEAIPSEGEMGNASVPASKDYESSRTSQSLKVD